MLIIFRKLKVYLEVEIWRPDGQEMPTIHEPKCDNTFSTHSEYTRGGEKTYEGHKERRIF